MTTEQFYELWERFSISNVAHDLPDNLEEYCEQQGITIDYFLMEFV
jgi:hypothetical protein